MVDPSMLGIGAGLAVGLAGLGTGLAQKDIGAAAVGAAAEKPEMFGRGLTLMVIPETIVLFGFVIAFLLMGGLPSGTEEWTEIASALGAGAGN